MTTDDDHSDNVLRSALSRRLRSTSVQLMAGAQRQVTDYLSRFENLTGAYERCLRRLIRQYPDRRADPEFVESFFGTRTLRFAGIDGTMAPKPMYDLLIFFAGAYASEGTVEVAGEDEMVVRYDEKYVNKGIGVSAVLPVFINEVREIDQTILERDENGEIDITVTHTDDWIVDNSAFADYMMGLAEFYLAFRLSERNEYPHILLMDRTLSAELSSFHGETAPERVNLDRESGLIGADAGGRPLTKTDWVYARRLFGNPDLGTPPARGEYLLPRIVSELLSSGPMTREEIMTALDLQGPGWEKRVDKVLKDAIRKNRDIGPVLKRRGERYEAIPQLRGLEDRIRALVDDVCGRIFSEDESILYDRRFKIDGRWLTTVDLAFLSLMSLSLTIQNCWRKHILLVGVAKDSSARDFKRQLVPTLAHVGRLTETLGATDELPDSDRMLFQWMSLREHARLKVPWATIEYDTAFKTIFPHKDGEDGLVSGARRNQISLNKTFVKAYFQLGEGERDPALRSNVMVYDRLVYPGFDDGEEQTLILTHDYGTTHEPVKVVCYCDADSKFQQLIMALFSRMTKKSVPELFGHIKPLFIADKVAKYYYKQFSRLMNSTQTWIATRPELRKLFFYLTTFRERRSEIESTRRSA